MVLNVPEIPPKVTEIVTLSGGRWGGPRKTTLSLFKDVTIRFGWAGFKGKGLSLYMMGGGGFMASISDYRQ